MSELIKSLRFEGSPIAAVFHNGEPHIIANDLGDALGYAEKSIGRLIRAEWSRDFITGRDFVIVEGDDLAELKACDRRGESDSARRIGARLNSLMLLTESGVDLVLLKTEKPVGVRLRRFLVDEVMPKLRRGETIGGKADHADSHRRLVDNAAIRMERERRLNAQRQAQTISRLAKLARDGGIAERAATSWEMVNLSKIDGLDVSRILPHEPEPEWLTPTDIATKLETSLYHVGRAISRVPTLKDRGNIDGLCRAVVNAAPGNGRTVTSYLYSDAAVKLIAAEVRAVAPPGLPAP